MRDSTYADISITGLCMTHDFLLYTVMFDVIRDACNLTWTPFLLANEQILFLLNHNYHNLSDATSI